jgi:hypothetical protein
MAKGATEVRRNLEESDDGEYALYRELMAEGYTDYVAWPIDHTLGKRHFLTFASDAPGGFRDGHLAYLRDLLPALALISEIRIKNRLARTLLETYVGPHASELILAGSTTRGSGTTVGAAIWALLFDSASSLAPATRGVVHARFLRIGGDGGAIEAELTGIGTDDVRLMGALNVGTLGASKATVVLEPSKGAAVRAPVGDGGTFDLRVPSSAKAFTLSVRVGRRVVARSPRLDVAAR